MSLDFRLGLFILLVIRRLAVPAVNALHKGNALALQGVQQDHGRLALAGSCLFQRLHQRVIVMAVDLDDIPVEGFKFLVQRLGRHDIAGRAVDLQAVDIDHGAQIVQSVLGRGHCRLPDLTLRDLAVAADGINTIVLLCGLARQRHTHRSGNALTQRTGGHIHTVDMTHIRMTGIMSLDGTEQLQILDGEEAAQCQHRIQRRRGVTLGQHKTVTVRIFGVCGIDIHFVEIECREGVNDRKTSADMSGCGGMHRVQCQQACPIGHDFQLFAIKFFHKYHSFSLILAYLWSNTCEFGTCSLM